MGLKCAKLQKKYEENITNHGNGIAEEGAGRLNIAR